MADFTVEGIIDVDASRAIRELRKFKNELKSVLAEIKAVDEAIKDLDGTRINIDVDSNTDEIRRLREEMQELRDETVNIDVASDAAREAQKVLDELNRIGDENVEIDVDADTDEAMDEFERLHREMMALGERDVAIDVELSGTKDVIADAVKLREEVDALVGDVEIDVDIKDSESKLARLREAFSSASFSLGSPGRGGLIGGIALLATTLVPLTAVAAGVAGGIVSSFTVMGTAVASFGLLAKPTITEVKEAVKLLSTETKDLDAAGLKEYNKSLQEMKNKSPGIYEVATAFMKLKENYEKFAKALQPKVLDAMNQGLASGNILLREMSPIADRTADAIVNLFTDMKNGLRGDDWQRFFDYVESRAEGFTNKWGHAVGRFITGIANMIVAFDPLTRFVNRGFRGMSIDFLNWSRTLDENQSFQNFIRYVQENGPTIFSIIGQMVRGLIAFGKAIEPIGSAILDFVSNMARMYQAFKQAHPQLAEFLTKMGFVIAVLAPFAGVISSLAGPVSALVGAIGGIAAAGVAVVGFFIALGTYLAIAKDKTSQYNEMVGKMKTLWSELKETGGELKQVLMDLWGWLQRSGAAEMWQQSFQSLFEIIRLLLPLLKPLVIIFGTALVGAFISFSGAVLMAFKALEFVVRIVMAFVRPVVGLFQWMYDRIVGHSIVPDLINGIINWFRRLPGAILGIIGNLISGVIGKFNDMRARVTSAVSSLKDAVVSRFQSMAASIRDKAGQAASFVRDKFAQMKSFATSQISALQQAVSSRFNAMVSSIRSHASSMLSTIRDRFSAAKSAATQQMEALRSSAVSKFQAVVSAARSILGNVKGAVLGAFAGAGGWLVSAGSSIIGGLISGITSRLGTLRSLASQAAGLISKAFPGSPVKEGPLKSLNHGHAGKEIVRMIASGIRDERGLVTSEMAALAGDMAKPIAVSANMPGDMRTASAVVSSGGGGGHITHNQWNIEVKVPVGANKAQIGKELVDAITAYENAGGRGGKKKRKGGQ